MSLKATGGGGADGLGGDGSEGLVWYEKGDTGLGLGGDNLRSDLGDNLRGDLGDILHGDLGDILRGDLDIRRGDLDHFLNGDTDLLGGDHLGGEILGPRGEYLIVLLMGDIDLPRGDDLGGDLQVLGECLRGDHLGDLDLLGDHLGLMISSVGDHVYI